MMSALPESFKQLLTYDPLTDRTEAWPKWKPIPLLEAIARASS